MSRFSEKDKDRDVTVFGEKTRFNGVLKFTEELHIAGTFTGSIEAQGALVIRKGATCDVKFARAASIVVDGVVNGPLMAGDRIEMRTGSAVHGDISTSRLRIADGVAFDGSVEMMRANNGIDLFSTPGSVVKDRIRADDGR